MNIELTFRDALIKIGQLQMERDVLEQAVVELREKVQEIEATKQEAAVEKEIDYTRGGDG